MRKFLALLAMIVSISALAACGNSHGANPNPASLTGEWHQVNSNADGWMTASISGESIQVNLRSRSSSSIFWMGSFDTSRKPVGKFKVVSLGDQDAMKWQITASTEPKKTFTYDNGVLSFKFSAMGSSTIVHMIKSKPMRTSEPTRTATKTPAFNQSTIRTPKTKTPAYRRSIPKSATPKVVSPPKISVTKK